VIKHTPVFRRPSLSRRRRILLRRGSGRGTRVAVTRFLRNFACENEERERRDERELELEHIPSPLRIVNKRRRRQRFDIFQGAASNLCAEDLTF
jgi:hypothetical protein